MLYAGLLVGLVLGTLLGAVLVYYAYCKDDPRVIAYRSLIAAESLLKHAHEEAQKAGLVIPDQTTGRIGTWTTKEMT